MYGQHYTFSAWWSWGIRDMPLFNGHQDSLDKETFEDLRADALEKPGEAFMVDNELHDLRKSPKWLPVSFPRGPRLQTDLRHDQRLRGNSSQRLRNGPEDCSGVSNSRRAGGSRLAMDHTE